MNIVRGSAKFANESAAHGWVVGHMHDGLAYTKDHEIKLWDYPTQPDYPPKTFHGTEFIVIHEGVLRFRLEKDGETREIVLNGSEFEYVILEPGITKEVFVEEAPAVGVTVRWPSTPSSNVVHTHGKGG